VITTFVRRQLVAFVVVALLGMAYVGVKYVGLDRYFGGGGYRVSLQLASSGGIFSNAEVTYRGVPVGRVGALTLTPDGVAAELIIADTAAPIPSSLTAVVANRSAVGEQYVDLRPDTDRGPFLGQGSVIAADRTQVPIPTEVLLTNLDGFVRSVPLNSLQTVVSELGQAFQGKGTDLQRLLDQGNTLTDAATAALPQTLALIKDGRTVLDTQNAQRPAIQSFSADLGLIARQLQASDPDLRRLITTGQASGAQVSAFLGASAAELSALVANLLTVTDIASPRQTQIRTLFQVLPDIISGGFTTVPGDGTAHFGAVMALNDPPVCTAGYEGTAAIVAAQQAKDPAFDDSKSTAPLNTAAYCAEPRGSPTSVRGAQNAPRPGVAAAVAAPGTGTPAAGGAPGAPGLPAAPAPGGSPLPPAGGNPLLTLLGQLLPPQ
jgi:phospholipid/cholesterol/gamma-HCH transport system substrate-binding protein